MVDSAARVRRVSIRDYLAAEAAGEERHEYHDGDVLAMSGGTIDHGRVTRNLVVALASQIQSPCEVFDSNVRVGIPPSRRVVYPDASVVSGGVQFHEDDDNQTTVVNPKAVFEMLSRSTERPTTAGRSSNITGSSRRSGRTCCSRSTGRWWKCSRGKLTAGGHYGRGPILTPSRKCPGWG